MWWMWKFFKVFENWKWETRGEEIKIEPLNVLLRILWIYYDCHSIILLRNCTRLYRWSSYNDFHPYYGWQYFAGRYSSTFNPCCNIYFLYRGLNCILFYLKNLMIMVYLCFYYVRENIMSYSVSCDILKLMLLNGF